MAADEYLDIAQIKRYLRFAEGDESEDSLLQELGAGAATRFRNFLLSLDRDPPVGAAVTQDMKNAVAFDVCRKYSIIKKNWQAAESFGAERDDAREGIETGIKRGAEEEFQTIRRF